MGFDTVNTMETPTLPRRQRVKKAVKEPREREEEDPGCLALLKKISCSLQCGGTTCSIKETEQVSASSLSASSCESLTSVEPKKPSARKRRASSKPPQAKDDVGPAKRVRRACKKSLPETRSLSEDKRDADVPVETQSFRIG